jgi:hypothetical protein
MRTIAQILIAGLLIYGIAFMGRFEVGSTPEQGMLRLAWRMTHARVRICEERSDAQVEKTLKHMRAHLGCVTRVVAYRLRFVVEGKIVHEELVAPSGIHGDRPLTVHSSLWVPPGVTAAELTFEPDEHWVAAHLPRLIGSDELAELPRLAWQGNVIIERGRIAIITLGSDGRSFRVFH